MKLIAKIFVAVAANAIALWVASEYITGFTLTNDPKQFLEIALIFTVLNFILKPILKLVLGPVIILTLGLGLIVVNALVLKILDIFSTGLTIEGIPTLLYATLLIGVINFIFHYVGK
jgi:putative membrane protein